MRIAVIGAGAIGSLVAGYLKLKDNNVTLIGRSESVKIIKEKGLAVSGVRGNIEVAINAADKLDFIPELAILATKTQDIASALKENKKVLQAKEILTMQNGVQADEITAECLSRKDIISSIVMFGSTCLEPGKVTHNFEGSWIIGRIFEKNDEKLNQISRILNSIFPVVIADGIKGMKYLKIFVNANNCIPAILGISMQEAFSDIDVGSVSIAIWKESLDIVKSSGINLLSLPDFPLERLIKLASLPTREAAKIYSGIMTNLSKEPLYGSILQSIKRGKLSEIDYINGEFVTLAQKYNLTAPLNKKLVEMVHAVEQRKEFFTKEELISATGKLFN